MVLGINRGTPSVMNATAKMAGGVTATGSSVVNNASTNIHGPINIASQYDADYFFKRLNRNSQLASMGVST